MSASGPQLDRIQQHQSARFKAMDLDVRAMPDGRSVLVSLPLGDAPFESLRGPLPIPTVVFASVGHDQIKCLRPRPLFDLPLLDVKHCTDPSAIEAVIRLAYRDRDRKLQEVGRWLAALGIDAAPSRTGTTLEFPLAGESPDARVQIDGDFRATLPSAGPLRGLSLGAREDRVIEIPRRLDSAADLECLIAARIDALKRDALKRDARERQRSVLHAPAIDAPRARIIPAAGPLHQPKVLLVGPGLIEDAALRQALKRRGYRMATARSETEALLRLASMTPDLVLSEYALGRSDGATLVQTTRAVAGIEGIPVVLLDTAAHENRREAARAVGAAGYVILQPDRSRFVKRLGRLLETPKARRFTRYPGRFSARLQGLTTPCVATEVGRGGVFIATEADVAMHDAMTCELVVPELGRDLRFEGEVLYKAESQGALPGLGLRFADISPEDEAALIAYLTRLDAQRLA